MIFWRVWTFSIKKKFYRKIFITKQKCLTCMEILSILGILDTGKFLGESSGYWEIGPKKRKIRKNVITILMFHSSHSHPFYQDILKKVCSNCGRCF